MPSLFKSFLAGVLILVCAQTQAQTAVISRNGQPLPQSGKLKWNFLSVAPGAKAYFGRVIVEVPGGKSIRSVSGPGVLVRDKWIKPKKVMIALGNLKGPIEVEYTDGSKETWQSEIKLAKPIVVLKGCKEAGLKVEQSKSNIPPVFFAAECSVKEDRILFNASVPGDLEWDVTSIFETEGKGERWKIFEIARNNLVAGNDTVATLGFRWNDGHSTFTILQDRGKIGSTAAAAKDKGNRTKFRVDFGGTQFETKTPAVSASGFGPYAGAELISKELFWKLRSLLSAKYVFPLSGGNFYEFTGGLGKAFGKFQPGTSTFGLFAEYDAVGQSQEADDKTVTFQHNQFGVSALYAKTMLKSELKILARYSGLGGDSTSIGIQIAYEGLFYFNQPWGLVLGYGSQSASAPAGTSTFGQMSLGATLTF